MSLIDEITPKRFQQTVQRGRKRMENFRKARLHFIKKYCGAYYDKVAGEVGGEAMNLLYNAISTLLPTMVLNFPRTEVMTPYLQQREYANLLGLALDQQDMKLDMCNVYRRLIVDAIFTLGILKTGLAQSDNVYVIDDDLGQESLDNGTIYTMNVSFDNYVVDPNSKEHLFKDASFMGDCIPVPRRMLLEAGYKEEYVMKLPRMGDRVKDDKASGRSMQNIDVEENYSLEDTVEIAEIWVPAANAIVTVPASKDVNFEDYLRVADYYGIKEGPYTLLALTPPVPDNPLPVPMVGIWYDLHVLANRMAKKIIEQAERQKDLVAYKPSAADDAEALQNEGDGGAVKVEDLDSVKTVSFGGQQNSNENHLASLQNWFNAMSGNTDQIGGTKIDAKSATAANILQKNSSIRVEDAKDMVYIASAGEKRRRAFYLHTDPLIHVPMIKRQMQDQTTIMPHPYTGQPVWMTAPAMQDVQVVLTPEMRSGDFMDFTFKIEPESMGRKDSQSRLAQATAFAQQIMPAVAATAQIFMSLGIPFSPIAFMLRMAKDSGIEWMDEVVYDPQFQQQMMQRQLMGPQDPGKAGGQQPNGGLMPAMLQNGQPGQVQAPPMNPQQQFNQQAQGGAQQKFNAGEMEERTALRGAFKPTPAPAIANI